MLPALARALDLESSAPTTSETMHLDARELDVTGPAQARRVEARGDAVFRSGEVEIRADAMVMDQRIQHVEATGNVTSTAGPDFMHAQSLRYDMTTRQSTLQGASLVSPSSQVYVRSYGLQQHSSRRFSLTDATLSTCTCDLTAPPAYLRARSMDVDLDSYARMRNAVVYLEGVPVFASPFLMIPLGNGRRTGFLFPRFGFSGRDGFRLVPAFIWVTSPRTELLLEGIVETRRGLGGNAHFGYSTVATEGYLRGGYMYELWRARSPTFTLGSWMNPAAAYAAASPVSLALPPPAQRWTIDTSHSSRLGDFARARLQSTLVSDSNYYRDLGTNLDDFSRERSATRAEAYLWHRRTGLSLDAALITQSSSRDTTRLQRLPRLTATAFEIHPQAGLSGIWDLQLENHLIDYQPRLFALHPDRYTHEALAAQAGTRWRIETLHSSAGGLSLEAGLRSYTHAYKSLSAQQVYPAITQASPNPQTSLRPWLRPALDVTLERVGTGGIVHWIRPYLDTLLTSYHGDSTQVSVWLGEEASSDWLVGGHLGIENGLALPAGTLTGRVYLSQATYATGYRERLQYLATGATASWESSYHGASAALATYKGKFARLDTRQNARYGRVSASLGYSLIDRAMSPLHPVWFEPGVLPSQNLAGTRKGHEIFGALDTPVWRWIALWGDARYSATRSEVVTWGAGTRLSSHCQCWDLTLGWRALPDPAPDRLELLFTMLGLGSSTLD